MSKPRSMTDKKVDEWAFMAPVHQIQRLTDWANSLEKKVGYLIETAEDAMLASEAIYLAKTYKVEDKIKRKRERES